MALYEVIDYFDVWGNAVDGYEVNNQSREGEVMIRNDWTGPQGDKLLLTALAALGHLGGERNLQHVLAEYEDGELLVGDDGGDGIEIQNRETAWACDDEWCENSDSYIERDLTAEQVSEEMTPEGDDPVECELVVGHRPNLGLHPLYNELDAKPFWRAKRKWEASRLTQVIGGDIVRRTSSGECTLELRISPEKPAGHATRSPKRSKLEQEEVAFQVESWVDGEFFGTFDFPHDFDDEELLGLSVEAGMVHASADDVSEQRVALDAFFERAGVAQKEFLHAPAYQSDDEKMSIVRKVAELFSKKLVECIEANLSQGETVNEAMVELARRNASPEYTEEDAAHDFCDANVPMMEALAEAGAYGDPEEGGRPPENLAEEALWGAAWDLARANNFFYEPELEVEPAPEHPTAAELEEMPTLAQGQTGNLKFDNGRVRIWLERVGIADGMPYDNGVVIEHLVDGRWVTVEEYEG